MINQAIRRLLQKHKTNCPFDLAKQRGIILKFDDLGDSTFGMYYTKFRQRYIIISNKISEEWQRVVCAHELGHDLLHFAINRFFVDSHTFFLSAKQERQANIFAVQLLTANDTIDEGESVFDYFCRINIPDEMVAYYKGVS